MGFVLELSANALNAAAIVLAGRNSVHTWWTGIVGCTLFGVVFYGAKLYADATLQVFFIVTSCIGWYHWRRGRAGAELPVKHSSWRLIATGCCAGVLVTLGYAALLRSFTDAAAPLPDSAVLAFSVLGQLLLMGRRVESWWCWLIVNTISVPLFASRGLYLTSVLYFAFWVNAVVSLRHWNRLAEAVRRSERGAPPTLQVAGEQR